MPSKRPRWLPHPLWLTASLAIVLAALVPTAYLLMPHVHRWHTLNQLTESNLDQRERALNYVIRRAGSDAAVRAGAIERLGTISDQANFVQMVNALDRAGVWSRDHVPDAAWLRWLGILTESGESGMRRVAAEELAKLTARADDATMHARLRALLNDDEVTVRETALHTAALLAGHANDQTPFTQLIEQRTNDDTPTIARFAWILLGLLDHPIEPRANGSEAPPEVAEARLWAAVRNRPTNPSLALETLTNADAPTRLRAMAIYALSATHDRHQVTAIAERIRVFPTDDDLLRRRQLLLHADLLRHRFMVGTFEADPAEIKAMLMGHHDEPIDPVYIWRTAPHIDKLTFADSDELNQVDATALLAFLENCRVGAIELPELEPLSSMLRMAAVRKLESPEPEILRPALSSPHATVRDLACIVAAERFNGDALEWLIASLLTDLNDDAKMSGSILAGLTGLQMDLLRERAEEEDIWVVRKIMQLGLWMQDDASNIIGEVRGLLTRADLPQSTVLLAMLHRRHPAGLDDLLAPHGEPPADLRRLLVHYRWWQVLDHFLPYGAPPIWLWADASLQRFQIDVLRAWHLLHRHELTRPAETN